MAVSTHKSSASSQFGAKQSRSFLTRKERRVLALRKNLWAAQRTFEQSLQALRRLEAQVAAHGKAMISAQQAYDAAYKETR